MTELVGSIAAMRAFFTDAGETTSSIDGGFRIYRRTGGRSILVSVRLVDAHAVVVVTCNPGTAPVRPEERAPVLALLNELNAELGLGTWILREYPGFRVHAYLNGDGTIDARVLRDTVDFATGVIEQMGDRVAALIAPQEYEIEDDEPPVAVSFADTIRDAKASLDAERRSHETPVNWTGAGEQVVDDDHLD